MALVSKSIPNLINGVSQQPAALRLESQGEAQENGLSDVVDGLKKRPPTQFLNTLVRCSSNWTESTAGNLTQGNLTSANTQALTEVELNAAYVDTYKRSSDEQYTVVILPDATTPIVLAYDILGNLRYESNKSSWLADGSNITYTDIDTTTNLEVTRYGNDDDTAYLVGLSATALDKTDITSTSVADATFIVNKTKTVEMDSSLEPEDTHNEALVYLKSTNYGREYTVKITSQTKNTTIDSNGGSNGTTPVATGETDSSNNKAFELRVSNVISSLRSNLVSKADVAVTVESSRKTPYGYAESRGISSYSKGNKVKGNLFIPFGADNQSIDPNIAGTSNAVTNKYLLQVTAGGRVVPHGSFDIVTSPYAGIEINANYGFETDRKKARQTRSTSKSVTVTDYYPSKEIVVTKVAADQTNQNIQFYPHTYNEEPFFVISTVKSNDANDTSFGDFDILVTDDDGGSNLRAFKDNAKSFTDLPNQCVEGFRIGVVGDNQKKEDNFHVEFTGNGGSGYWKETVKAGIQNKFNLNTMPHTLRQDPDQIGSLRFSFNTGDWDERVAGDEDTNPVPSFVGQSINDIFFHRNRLGIIAGENVVFSEASGYFNFFRTTVRTLLDSAPIDVAVSQNEVSILKAAIPIQDNLLLFSELNQFTLSAAQLLTPTEVTIDQSTKFECDLEATPVSAGNSVFFATKSGSYAGIREYFTADDTEIKDAVSVTSHVPEYLAGNVRKMTASTNEDILICLTSAVKSEVYVYNWYNSNNERLQSAWSKWKFSKDVVDVAFNNADLYITFSDGSFEKMGLRTSTSDITYSESNSFSSAVTLGTNTQDFGGVSHTLKGVNTRTDNGVAAVGTTSNPDIDSAYVYKNNVDNTYGMYVQIGLLSVTGSATTPATSARLPTSLTIGGQTIPTPTWGFVGSTTNQYISTTLVITAQNYADWFNSGTELVVNIPDTFVETSAKSYDTLLDHRVRVTQYSGAFDEAVLDSQFTATPTSQFIDHRGDIIAVGNTTSEKAKVVAYINNQQHKENGVLVNNYVYAGEPYTFKYQLSEQVFKPDTGDTTKLARVQLRRLGLNYNDTGTFKVSVKSTGRDEKVTTFTGRILGQQDNLLGYSPVVEEGDLSVGIQSQAKETDITITNDSHLPCVFQSAEWEGFLTLRNKRL